MPAGNGAPAASISCSAASSICFRTLRSRRRAGSAVIHQPEMRAEVAPHAIHGGARGEGIDGDARQRRKLRRPRHHIRATSPKHWGGHRVACRSAPPAEPRDARDRRRRAAPQRRDCAWRRRGRRHGIPCRLRRRRSPDTARAFLPARRSANRRRRSAHGWRRRPCREACATTPHPSGGRCASSRIEEATTQSPARRCEASPPATPKLIMPR